MDKVLNMKNALKGVSNEVNRLHNHIHYLEDKIDDLENRSRCHNLVIHDIPEERSENWERVEKKVKQVLRDRMGITLSEQCTQRCHHIGRKRDDRVRPIV